MRFTVLSCSLRAESRSRRLGAAAAALLETAGHAAELIDLRALGGVPPFDDATAFDDPHYRQLHDAIAAADGIVIAAPIYNWGLGSQAKALIELTGATGVGERHAAWFDKLVTFACAGGLPHGYMGWSAVAAGLMMDFKCIVNPYLVYASERDWSEDDAPDAALIARLEKAVTVKLELAERLRGRRYRSGWEV